MQEENYPGLSLRVKAAFSDTLVLILLMIALTTVFDKLEHVPDYVRMVAFICVFFLYDPILSNIMGGTVGHLLFGIRVKKEIDHEKNILFPFALIRFLSKATLGWISLLTITSDQKNKAIHDIIAGSVVVYKY